jgi:hypothetical protein
MGSGTTSSKTAVAIARTPARRAEFVASSKYPLDPARFEVGHRPVNTRPLGMLRQRRAGCSTLHERPLFRPVG